MSVIAIRSFSHSFRIVCTRLCYVFSRLSSLIRSLLIECMAMMMKKFKHMALFEKGKYRTILLFDMKQQHWRWQQQRKKIAHSLICIQWYWVEWKKFAEMMMTHIQTHSLFSLISEIIRIFIQTVCYRNGCFFVLSLVCVPFSVELFISVRTNQECERERERWISKSFPFLIWLQTTSINLWLTFKWKTSILRTHKRVATFRN